MRRRRNRRARLRPRQSRSFFVEPTAHSLGSFFCYGQGWPKARASRAVRTFFRGGRIATLKVVSPPNIANIGFKWAESVLFQKSSHAWYFLFFCQEQRRPKARASRAVRLFFLVGCAENWIENKCCRKRIFFKNGKAVFFKIFPARVLRILC